MTFLQPGFLWGLFAIAIPVIIHLFNFRKPQKILFSNISLLKQVKKDVVRRIRLTQWLLLALRILAIIFIVLAFADPVFTDKNSEVLKGGGRSVVVLIDDSYSMSLTGPGGNGLLQARTITKNLLKDLNASDQVFITVLSQVGCEPFFTEPGGQAEKLDNLELSRQIVHFSDVIGKTECLFRRAVHPNRLLIVISDFQNSTILSEVKKTSTSIGENSPKFLFVPVHFENKPNDYFSEFSIKTLSPEKGKKFELEYTLSRTEDSEGKETETPQISIYGGEKQLSISEPSQTEKGIWKGEASYTVETPGWQIGSIILNGDEVAFDNQIFFSYNVPEKKKILYLYSTKPNKFLDVFYSKLSTSYVLETSSFQSANGNSISNYDFIIADVSGIIPPYISKGIQNAVQKGKGLLIIPDEKTDLSSLNACIAGLEGGQVLPLKTYQNPKRVKSLALKSGFFDGVFQKNSKNEFVGPLLMQSFGYNSGKGSDVLLSAEPEVPFLVSGSFGMGKYFILLSRPDEKWSDFPYHSSFPPVMERITAIGTGTNQNQYSITLGSGGLFKVQTESDKIIVLRDKSGKEFIPEQFNQTGQVVLRFTSLHLEPGHYTLEQNGNTLAVLSMNANPVESFLNFPDKGKIEEWAERYGVRNFTVLDPEALRLDSGIIQASEGIKLWKLLVILGLVFLISESILASVISKKYNSPLKNAS